MRSGIEAGEVDATLKPMINWLTLLVFALPGQAKGSNSNQCVPKLSREVTSMSPVRSQDTTGFCYAVAATQVLQQHLCKDRAQTTCPNDLSLVDGIVMANGRGDRGMVVATGEW